MGDLDESMSKAATDAERMKAAMAEGANYARTIIEAIRGGGTAGNNTAGGHGGGNARSSAPYDFSNASSNFPMPGGGFETNGQFQGTSSRSGEAGRNLSNMVGSLVTGLGGAAGAMVMAMPSGNEALNASLAASRLRFYGGSEGVYGRGGSFDLQRRMSQYGTSTSPLDAAIAANFGAGAGLLPGLQGYSSGGSNRDPFNSILGGGTLASNLLPGLGLTGGMGAVSSLNQARNVNLLRMIGVDVRSAGGDTMNPLGNIINQLWKILTHANGGSPPTKADIALSSMSGNALDSILNQYFSDPNLRQVVTAALIQMAATKNSNINAVGGKVSLMGTGGTISTVGGISNRNTAELNLIQQYSGSVLKGVNMGNNMTTAMLDYLSNTANAKYLGYPLQGAAGTAAMLETIGGARNGAGALLLDAGAGALKGVFDTAFGGMFGKFGPVAKGIAGVAGGLVGASAMGELFHSAGTEFGGYGPQGGYKATGPWGTNIFVSMPSGYGQDFRNIGNSIADAVGNALQVVQRGS